MESRERLSFGGGENGAAMVEEWIDDWGFWIFDGCFEMPLKDLTAVKMSEDGRSSAGMIQAERLGRGSRWFIRGESFATLEKRMKPSL